MAEVRLSEANARLSAHGCGMDLGPFREFEGGELTFEAFTITDEEGKQHPMVSLSGSRSNVTLRRSFKLSDHALKRAVEAALNAGQHDEDADGVTIVRIDSRKVAFGEPDRLPGFLIGVGSTTVNVGNGQQEQLFTATFNVSQDAA
jgi:hypothetical protein